MKELRAEIDHIDDQLVSLIHQRASLVKKVGEVKQEFGKSFYDPKREDEIISRIIKNIIFQCTNYLINNFY